MKTLQEKLSLLAPTRRKKVAKRTDSLVAEQMAMRQQRSGSSDDVGAAGKGELGMGGGKTSAVELPIRRLRRES